MIKSNYMKKLFLHYEFLISCPSDIKKEIDIIVEEISKYNDTEGRDKDIYIQHKHWNSHTYPEYGGVEKGAQTIINKQILENCDAVIAIFWSRFGSPTENKFESGTVEEIEMMMKGDKHIMLYFSDMRLHPSKLDSEQYKKITEFKNKYKGLYSSYSTHKEFRDKFRNHLHRFFSNKNIIIRDDKANQSSQKENETRYGQLAERLIELMKNQDTISISNIFRDSITHGVASYFKSYLARIKDTQKEKFQLLLEYIYKNAINDEIVREQCCYYMCFLRAKNAIIFLNKVLADNDTTQLVKRGAYIGLLQFTKNEKYLKEYLLLLKSNPLAASVNAGYHQCHYGDKFQNEGYMYNNLLTNKMTIRGLLHHIKNENYKMIQPIDLFTLRYILYFTSTSILTNDQIKDLIEFVNNVRNDDSALLKAAKCELKEWFSKIKHINMIEYFIEAGLYIKKMPTKDELTQILQDYISSVYIDNDFYAYVCNRPSISEYNILALKDKSKFENLVDEILKYKVFENKELDILDLGCGYGAFLNVWNSRGIGKTYGIDLSTEAVQFSTRLYNNKNIIIEVGDALNTKETISKYKPHIICCFDFLEHIFDVELFLYNIKESTLKGNYLIIYIPVIKKEEFEIEKLEDYRYFFKDHIYYFTPEGIIMITKKFNFELVYQKPINTNKTLFIFEKQ